MRCDRAPGERMAREQALASLWGLGARRAHAGGPTCRSPARRAARRRRATRHRRSARPRRALRPSAASDGSGAGRRFSLSGGRRALPEGDLVDAPPAKMGVHPSHDHRGAVLRLERESAFDPEHQGGGSSRRVWIAFGGPRRPLQLDRPGMSRKRFADDGGPVGDQARLAQAARGERLGDQPGREFGQRLGAASARLHHRFDMGKRGRGG